MVLTNQVAGFFDPYYLWEKWTSPIFLHIVITQRKDKSESIFNWVWLEMPSYTQIFWDFALVPFGVLRWEVIVGTPVPSL